MPNEPKKRASYLPVTEAEERFSFWTVLARLGFGALVVLGCDWLLWPHHWLALFLGIVIWCVLLDLWDRSRDRKYLARLRAEAEEKRRRASGEV